MNKEFTIVGQGLAGSILSMRMYEEGIPFKVIDQPHHSQSSRIAAGLCNPVVLKRQKWVADAELYLPAALDFYQRWESNLGLKFHHPIALDHVFHSAGEVNDWHVNAGKPRLKNHLAAIHPSTLPTVPAPHGLGRLEGVFWLDTVLFLNTWRKFLLDQGLLIEDEWPINSKADFPQPTLFCNGHLLRKSHPQISEAFAPTKGEVMIIRADKLPEDRMLHAGVFTLPLGNKTFKVGASYAHDNLDEKISNKGLTFLKNKLEAFYQGPYEVLEQYAGVRPNIKDRKPLLGLIGESQYSFNGMGSRGVLMAPYLAQHFLDYLIRASPLKPEWDLQRFI
ncbi:NAD(P)/FAD-dependent oxidoreductase [Croceimicrobium sp.]|uniref:NAD(P)/FAD-dependent oxidoreductase n=1 Tax=Croceimicrobium sp. TaxID=2828340 RepID=UPI003BAB6909